MVLAIIAFRGALSELFRRWTTQEEYSHGFLIPVISLWLLWQRREALSSRASNSLLGAVRLLIVLAIFIHIVGQLSAMFILSQVAFVIVLLGIALSVGGRDVYLALPLFPSDFCFLQFRFPIF